MTAQQHHPGWRPDRLRRWRHAHGLSLEGLGDRLRTTMLDAGLSVPAANYQTLWQHEHGQVYPGPHYRRAYCLLYQTTEPSLGFRPPLPGEAVTTPPAPADDDPVHRRQFLRSTLIGGIALAVPHLTPAPVADLLRAALPPVDPARSPSYANAGDGLTVLLTHHTPPADPPSLNTLRQTVVAAKHAYQACRYTEVTQTLRGLLPALDTVDATTDEQRRTYDTLAAEAYHVVAGVQLKLGHHGPAWLAADRSMHAARRSQDPLAIAASARIVTHTLTDAGHHADATAFAARTAAELAGCWSHADDDILSVYGSLLLRGAIAAARADNRGDATTLLHEADEAARRLDRDDNHRRTGFGPANVTLHRIHIAVILGDAPAALDLARHLHPRRLTLVERRAAFLLDTAHAHAHTGDYDRAMTALRTLEQTAAEELRRPVVHQLVGDIAAQAHGPTKQHAQQLATRLGAHV